MTVIHGATEAPFPHLVLDGVFPERVYRRLVDAWPVRADIDQGAAKILLARNGDETGERERLPEVWRDACATLGRLAIECGSRLGAEAPRISGEALIERVRAYVLGPHVDNLSLRVSALFYVAEDASRPHLGTILYRHLSGPAAVQDEAERTRRSLNHAVMAHDIGADTQPATLIEWRPNRLFVMANGPTTWHGQHLSEDYRRRTWNGFLS